MEYKITGGNAGAKIYMDNQRERDGVCFFDVHMILENEASPEAFTISFSVPDVDVYSVWSPSIRFDRHIGPNWSKRLTYSRLASWMPLHALVSASGKNRMTLAISNAKTPISIRTGEREEDATILC